MLDHDFLTPLDLMKACGFDCDALDALVKYNEGSAARAQRQSGRRTVEAGRRRRLACEP
jgi:hypothetical protein